MMNKDPCDLPEPLMLLDKKIIVHHANLTSLQPTITLLRSTTSTQDFFKSTLATRDNPLICLAEHQTAGRGRLGRQWHSPFGMNLFFSCAWSIHKKLSELGGLSMVVGLAMIRALQEYGLQQPLQLKWPNDLYCQEQKLAGVLIDVQGESHHTTQIVIGIGMNINMHQANHTEINQAWTSLYQITQHAHNRSELAGRIIHWVFEYLQEFERHGLKQFLPIWQKHDYLKDREITLLNGQHSKTGRAMGINEQGQLLLDIEGEPFAFAAGDASVKK